MQKPNVSDGPNIEIDEDQKYIVELVDLEEKPSQFPESKPGDISLIWHFRLWNRETGEAVIDQNVNEVYELWQFSNDKTYRNPKTASVAKAREWAEALIGRELSDDEINEMIDAGFAESLIGKRGVADVEWYVTKTGATRLRIARLRPYKAPPKKPQAGSPREERELVGAGAASRRARAILDDDEEMAF